MSHTARDRKLQNKVTHLSLFALLLATLTAVATLVTLLLFGMIHVKCQKKSEEADQTVQISVRHGGSDVQQEFTDFVQLRLQEWEDKWTPLFGKFNNTLADVAVLKAKHAETQQRQKQGAAETNVHFHAVLKSNKIFEHHETVIFNEVKSNEGGGYNSSTGKFTSPANGTYLLLVTMAVMRNSPDTWNRYVDLVVDNSYVCAARSTFVDHYESGTCHAIVTLAERQRVWIRNKRKDSKYDYHHCYFSGVLLRSSVK